MNSKTTETFKNCFLDHVAIAVDDLDKSQKIYESLGLEFDDHREVVESQSVETAFAKVDENARIELLSPFGGKGPIYDFLKKKGPGIHHLCFRVEDIKSKTHELKEFGFRLIYEEAQSGADNCLVNFIHPKSTGGVLIEISQKLT